MNEEPYEFVTKRVTEKEMEGLKKFLERQEEIRQGYINDRGLYLPIEVLGDVEKE